jgi:hypothetical protein
MKKYFLFTTLAANQTEFFKKISVCLKEQGHQAGIVCFHERSMDLLSGLPVDAFNVFEMIRNSVQFEADLDSQFSVLISKYHFPDSQVLFSHEMAAFNIFDSRELKKKFIGYSEAMNLILTEIKNRFQGEVIVVQELGGFSSLLSSFYVARAHGLNHYFLEPAFFKGRCFILKNSWQALNISQLSQEISPETSKYLEDAIRNRRIVIPDKDKFHYLGLFSKIFRLYNFRRLFEKILDRYIFKKEEEFRYIWNYCFRHAKMFLCKFVLSQRYQNIPEDKFIYFPLHVPMDVALTLRSPHCLDQYHLIDLLCRSIPFGFKVVVKEHPAMVGVLSLSRMRDLLKKHENLILLNPRINNYEVLAGSELIVTVNSKSGAEALCLEKKVVVLGDAFYSHSPLVRHSTDLGSLQEIVAEELKKQAPKVDQIRRYFQSVWSVSSPGEIYSLDERNILEFCQLITQ